MSNVPLILNELFQWVAILLVVVSVMDAEARCKRKH
jgi:hypothetical protein